MKKNKILNSLFVVNAGLIGCILPIASCSCNKQHNDPDVPSQKFYVEENVYLNGNTLGLTIVSEDGLSHILKNVSIRKNGYILADIVYRCEMLNGVATIYFENYKYPTETQTDVVMEFSFDEDEEIKEIIQGVTIKVVAPSTQGVVLSSNYIKYRDKTLLLSLSTIDKKECTISDLEFWLNDKVILKTADSYKIDASNPIIDLKLDCEYYLSSTVEDAQIKFNVLLPGSTETIADSINDVSIEVVNWSDFIFNDATDKQYGVSASTAVWSISTNSTYVSEIKMSKDETPSPAKDGFIDSFRNGSRFAFSIFPKSKDNNGEPFDFFKTKFLEISVDDQIINHYVINSKHSKLWGWVEFDWKPEYLGKTIKLKFKSSQDYMVESFLVIKAFNN